jgi:hypothetical protein
LWGKLTKGGNESIFKGEPKLLKTIQILPIENLCVHACGVGLPGGGGLE